MLTAGPAALRERVTHARRVIARRAGLDPQQVEERAAASIVFLGLASRLISPALAATVLGRVVPRLTAGTLYWRPVDGGPWPLAAAPPVTGYRAGDLAADSDLSHAAALLDEHVIQGIVGPLADAAAAGFRLSPQVLWGNVASALAGAAGMLAGRYPEQAEAAGRAAPRRSWPPGRWPGPGTSSSPTRGSRGASSSAAAAACSTGCPAAGSARTAC